MRVGWNPVKRMRRQGAPARIVAATVTHIPFLAGFYAQSLDVLSLSLASLRAHTSEAFELWVFDNASCSEARAFLLEQHAAGAINRLILAGRNIGVLGAHNALFSAIPADLVAYFDSDVYFHPGWLPASLQVLETFPRAALVTAVPVRSAAAQAVSSVLALAAADAQVQHEVGNLIPQDWIADFCSGTGRNLQQYLAEWQGQPDHRVTYRGVAAYAGASAFQFVARRPTLQAALPLPDEWLLHGAGELLERIDAGGNLLLATDGLFVHHLGNTLPQPWRVEAERLGLRPVSRPLAAAGGPGERLARLPLIRRALMRLYDWLFRLLYGSGA